MKTCTMCDGYGQTQRDATLLESKGVVIDGVRSTKFKTIHMGCGCPVCLGLGIIGERRVYPGGVEL